MERIWVRLYLEQEGQVPVGVELLQGGPALLGKDCGGAVLVRPPPDFGEGLFLRNPEASLE